MNKKTKRYMSVALDVLLVIMIGLILFISINAIISKDKGYTSLFGKVIYAVETDSMKGEYKDSFDKNSLIFCKELRTEEERRSVGVGDVITFWFLKDGQRALNTHRIVAVLDADGPNRQYITKGDNAPEDANSVFVADVVAVFHSKIGGLGAVVLFAQSQLGFFVVAVIPSILLFGYCVVLFYSSFKKAFSKPLAPKVADQPHQGSAEISLDSLSLEQKTALREQLLIELSGSINKKQ